MRNRFTIRFRNQEPIFIGYCRYRDLSLERQFRITLSLFNFYKTVFYSVNVTIENVNKTLLNVNPHISVDELRLTNRYLLDIEHRYYFEDLLFKYCTVVE